MQKYTHIIWDWNGTLLNDVGAALASVNDMLARREKQPIDIVRYRECIGVPIIKFYEKVFELKNEDYDLLLKEYNAGYLRHLDSCGLTPGVAELLEEFESDGIRQIIVSSCEKNQLEQAVNKYGIIQYFDAVIGSDNFLAGSKIEKAKAYFDGKNGDISQVLVVGDLIHDCELAHEIGADCVLLASGHEQLDRLARAGAWVAQNAADIRFFVKNAQHRSI